MKNTSLYLIVGKEVAFFDVNVAGDREKRPSALVIPFNVQKRSKDFIESLDGIYKYMKGTSEELKTPISNVENMLDVYYINRKEVKREGDISEKDIVMYNLSGDSRDIGAAVSEVFFKTNMVPEWFQENMKGENLYILRNGEYLNISPEIAINARKVFRQHPEWGSLDEHINTLSLFKDIPYEEYIVFCRDAKANNLSLTQYCNKIIENFENFLENGRKRNINPSSKEIDLRALYNELIHPKGVYPFIAQGKEVIIISPTDFIRAPEGTPHYNHIGPNNPLH